MEEFVLHQEEKINESFGRLRIEEGWIYKFYESIRDNSSGMFVRRLVAVQLVSDLPKSINKILKHCASPLLRNRLAVATMPGKERTGDVSGRLK